MALRIVRGPALKVECPPLQRLNHCRGDARRPAGGRGVSSFSYAPMPGMWSTSTTTSGKSCSPMTMPASRGNRERPG